MERRSRTKQAVVPAWERFARDDPYTYILTSLKGQDPRQFWQSGEEVTQQELLPMIQTCCVKPGIALEVGCGVGRLAFPLARHFQKVVGVDISERMVGRARAFASAKHVHNATFTAIFGPEDFLYKVGQYAGNVNFLYSLLVFQHIPELLMIEDYLHAICILLEKNGTAYLQFDTRQQNYFYQVKSAMPDFLLPRFWRRGIRRVRRSVEEIELGFRRAGLEIMQEFDPHTSYHRYILRRAHTPMAAR